MSANQQTDKEQIFDAAADLDGPRRAAYLDRACGDDARLRAEIDELLRHDDDAGSFLEKPAIGLVPTIATGEFDTASDSPGETSLAFLQSSDKPGCIGTLQQYEVMELVGRGGMGLVLRAFDPKLNRVVAIKVMAPELAANAMGVKRFLREAQAAAAVSHDHVVTIHAIHDDHSPPFIVMEFVDGVSLQEKIDLSGALELKELLRIGMQTARGLAAAHEQGLVHRDIKPANILLENGVERVKITDFGLARAVDDVNVTQTGLIVGTPQFMSPEQAQGQPVDARSDLFSLGSVLYTRSTGRPPFRAETAVVVLRRVSDDDPRSTAKHWAAVAAVLLLVLFGSLTLTEATGLTQFTSTVIRIVTGEGTLVVEVDDPDVSVQIDGDELVITGAGVHEIRVRPGKHRIEALKNGKAVHQEMVTISRGGRVVVRVRLEPTRESAIAAKQPQQPAKASVISISKATHIFAGLKLPVSDLVFLPDGRRALSAGPGSSVCLWDLQAGRVVRRFEGHTGKISSVALSPDGRFAISGSLDKTARLWDIETGKEIRQFGPHLGRVFRVAISPDGHLLATINNDWSSSNPSSDYTIRLWDVETGKEIRQLVGHVHEVMSIEFSPDGLHLLSGSADMTVRLWETATGHEIRRFQGHQTRVRTVTFSPDGRYALSGSEADKKLGVKKWKDR